MMNMIRNGKLNYNLAVKQVNLFMPDGIKEVYLSAIEQCKNSGKKTLKLSDQLRRLIAFQFYRLKADDITDNCEYSFTLLQCFYKTSPVFMFP